MPSGARACSTRRLFEWERDAQLQELFRGYRGRHEGNRVSVKDVLFGRAVILRAVRGG